MPIIDAHMHLGPAQQRDWTRVEALSDERMIALMDRYHIEKGFFSAAAGIMYRPEDGNELTWQAMCKYPDRVLGYINTNPHCGRRAVDEIDKRCQQGFRGLKLGPVYNNYCLTDSFVFPVVEKAMELNLPILIHIRHGDGDNLRGMMERYPRAKVIVAHLWEVEKRAQVVRDYDNVMWEISGAGGGYRRVEEAVRLVGAEKLLFGSDLNICYVASTLLPIQKSFLTEKQKELILYKNAKRYFGL